MYKVIVLQLGGTIVAAALSAVFFGFHGAITATLVGLAFTVPNALLVIKLTLAAMKTESVSPTVFFVGEGVKLLAIIGLLVLIQVLYADMHWGAFIVGLVLMLKANLFAFLVKT